MAILCYVSEELLKDARNHGIQRAKIDKLVHQVETSQSLAVFNHFPYPCLTKKQAFARNFRLVAVERRVGEHLVVVLLRLMVRGGSEYEEFCHDAVGWAARHADRCVSDEELASWVADRTREDPPTPPPPLTDREKTFLWGGGQPDCDDTIICETHEWMAGIAEPRINNQLVRLAGPIVQAADGTPGQVREYTSREDPELTILAYVVPDTRQCILLRAARGETASQRAAAMARWSERLKGRGTGDILRECRRSYPSIVCYDDDLWMTVQRDPQANLALSPEEAEVLRAALSLDPRTPSFPLFINGRAGSGKSTLLQYLFARTFFHWIRHFGADADEASRPLYCASSAELLEVARGVVKSLLRANHEHLLAEREVTSSDFERLERCFQQTRDFLREAAGAEAEARFPVERHVTYAKFRQMWNERFGRERGAREQYGPQISWHVIRGLIKGLSLDATLSRDDYDDLPQEERTVSREVYEAVYERVWSKWYEPLCRKGKVWDNLDLVRFLLEGDRLPASHMGIFCDEAQDFTRLEIEALYRCSVFSHRTLDVTAAGRVPYVFAGDPFQTLNPTGFRWESVRAAFTERLIQSLYRFHTRRELPTLPYRELTFNYRSSKRIVDFCNSIQAVRAVLFDHRSLRPQQTWRTDDPTPPPYFFEKGDPVLEEAIRNQPDLVLIVPCEEGEEIEYVAGDPYLRSIVQIDDQGTPRNVLSATRAKGIEFLRVALYGWAERPEAARLATLLKAPSSNGLSIDERLGLEYFLNNLYVAASRAQRRLFVIDDKQSHEALWWFVIDESHLHAVLQRAKRCEEWRGASGTLVQGVAESFADDHEDPAVIAGRFEREGLTNDDSYLLRQASQHYRLANQSVKAHSCRGRADWLDKKYREAGDSFEKAGEIGNAVDAYWRGRHYRELVRCAERHPHVADHACCRIARFLVEGAPTPTGCRSLFRQLADAGHAHTRTRSDLQTPEWSYALEQALRRVLPDKDRQASSIPLRDAGALADALALLEELGASVAPEFPARLLFAAKRYPEILRRFAEADCPDIFRDARARFLIEQVDEGKRTLDPQEAYHVADYYFRQHDWVTSAHWFRQAGRPRRVVACLKQLVSGDHRRFITVLVDALEALIDAGQWNDLVALVTEGALADEIDHVTYREQPRRTAIVQAVDQKQLVYRLVIPALATSDRLTRADYSSRECVATFLEDRLIRQPMSSWRGLLAPRVAGAAIERTGFDIQALRYYEQWGDSSESPDEERYARQRWIVCKLRQADREERNSDLLKADTYREIAREVVHRYGWSEKNFTDGFPRLDLKRVALDDLLNDADEPDLPATPRAGDHAAAPRHTSGRIDRLVYRVFPSNQWVNLESDDGLTARIEAGRRQVNSSDVTVERRTETEYAIVEWKLIIEWVDEETVRLRTGTARCDIPVAGQRHDEHADQTP